MRIYPVPYLGRTLLERHGNGLRATFGSFPPGRQALHVHAHPAFSVLVAGRAVDRSRRDAYDQPPLTAVFHPTSEPHANDIGPDGVLGFTLELEPSWLEAQELEERALGRYRVLAPSAQARLACLALLGTAGRTGVSADADLETHALEFVELLLRTTAVPPITVAPRWLIRGEEFLRAHFRAPVTLRSAAREAGVHPVYFARLFRRRFGCTVSAYLRTLRLVEAGELILGSDNSLADIACRAGFADQPHLTRCCARVLGITPGALRRLRMVAGDRGVQVGCNRSSQPPHPLAIVGAARGSDRRGAGTASQTVRRDEA